MRNKRSGEQGNELPGRGKNRCKGPEVGVLVACFEIRKEDAVIKWVSSLLHTVSVRGCLES